jgi:leader peptidase (prepilin peptidase)/N-methyltransferase
MSYILSTGYFFYGTIFLLGLAIGSFLNAWVWRTRENFRIISGRSMCLHCRRQLCWYENIPVVSFLFLRGVCRTCKNPIPTHYLWVEIITALVLLLLAWQNFHNAEFSYLYFFRNLIFAVILIIIFIYDFLYEEILSDIIWFGALVGLFFNLYLHYSLTSMLLGALAAGGFFLFQFVISRGRWIGGGDVRLGVLMGLWLGWPVVLVALVIAYIVGAISSIFLLVLKRKTLQSATPFGTYLALGTLVCILWGNEIVQWYMLFLR